MAKPEKTFKIGAVSASVFLNEGDEGAFRTITLQRRYKKDESWDHRAALQRRMPPPRLPCCRRPSITCSISLTARKENNPHHIHAARDHRRRLLSLTRTRLYPETPDRSQWLLLIHNIWGYVNKDPHDEADSH